MNDIWYEEVLEPDAHDLETLFRGVKGVKSQVDRARLSEVRGAVRLHTPREKVLNDNQVGKLAVSNPEFHYILLRLGCEFDPGSELRAAKAGFVSARLETFLWGDGNIHPRVYSLAPVELTSGRPKSVYLKLGPSITLVSGASGSLGSLETEIAVGQVAPTVRGFAGDAECQPYWNLEHHREAPLYGMRHFWLILEAPPSLERAFLSCRAEGVLQTTLGRLRLRPKEKAFSHRPRRMIHFASS